jgi:hypothetical protein
MSWPCAGKCVAKGHEGHAQLARSGRGGLALFGHFPAATSCFSVALHAARMPSEVWMNNCSQGVSHHSGMVAMLLRLGVICKVGFIAQIDVVRPMVSIALA